MPVIPNLFDEEKSASLVVPNLFDEDETKKSLVVPNLFDEEKPKTSFLQESIIKPFKTFYGGVLKSAANFADTLDFYADKIAQKLNLPETKNSIFEYLRDNWNTYGEKLQKEGVTNKLVKEIYSGLGQAGFEIPKLMAMGPQGLVISGALEGGKQDGIKGAFVGGTAGALTKGMLKGLGVLPTKVKLPTAFSVGAITTPGELEEKIAGGAILAGLSLGGKSPTMREFKETQAKYSPLVKAYQKILPYEARERIYQHYINRFQSIENIVQKAKNLGLKLLPGENPALRARTYLGIGNKVRAVLEDKTYRITPEGKIEITGEGLKPILDSYDRRSPIKGKIVRENDLKNYLIARRTILDLQRPKSEFTTEQIVTPQQVKQAKSTLRSLYKKYGTNITLLSETAQRLYDYQKRVLHLLVDSGNLSQKQYDVIVAKNPHYVPFDRVIEGIEPTGIIPVSKQRFTEARAPIKRIKGSELEIHNPIESIIKNTYRIMDIADRNTIARGIAKISNILPEDISPVKIKMRPIKVTEKEAGEEKILFRPSQFKPKGNIIEYFENGKRKYMEVTPNLYQAMTGLNETSLGLMTQIMSRPAHWLRVGATITPEFMVRNPIRDQFTALLQTSFGFRPFVDSGGAIADILNKTNIYYDWLRSGGSYSGFVELSRPKLKQALLELKKHPNLLKNLNIIVKAQDISQLFEQTTRLGVYKTAIKRGITPIEAGFESREATIDFARRGAKTKDINAVIAFFNAGIQGVDKSIRTAMADPAGFAMKAISTITIPSLLLYLKNRNDPDYKEIPQWQRDLFWVTKIGETYIRIPKPFLYGQVFGSIPERFFEYLDTQDKQAFKGLEKALYDAISPVSGDPASGLLATGIKPLIENAANWNFFLERNIVPESKQKLLPQDQYKKYTTETAKKLGEFIKYPPAKIENLATGWFGGTGKYALQVGDMLIKGIKKASGEKIEPKRPMELADIPLIKGFVARPVYSQPESIDEFYKNKIKLDQAYNSYKQYLKENNKKKADLIKTKYPDLKFAPLFNQYAEVLSNYNQQIDRIIASDKYSEKMKREKIAEIEKKQLELAKKANALLGKNKKSLVIPNLFD